jgi:hypothetical protein
MLDIICKHTNDEGSCVFTEINGEWKEVVKEEFFAFVGILILRGVLKKCKEPVYELWAVKSLYYRPVFPATVFWDHFFQIFRCLCFNDKNSHVERQKDDKLAQIREVYEIFVASFRLAYVHTEYITVDEQLVPCRGQCPLRQYMKSKPAKYGIKIWVSYDANTYYTHNMQVYTRKKEGEP